MNTPEPTGPYAALRIPDFRLYISSRFFITLAIQIQSVVVAWQVYELTKDPLALGLIGLAEAIPSIGVSLYAGHLADVMQRKKIILICVSTLLLCSSFLLFFTFPAGQFFSNLWGLAHLCGDLFKRNCQRVSQSGSVFVYAAADSA
jgi:MFS family permease